MTNNFYYVEDVNNCTKKEYITVLTNRGSIIFDRKVGLIFLTLSFNVKKNYLATILSLKYVNNIAGVRVTIDTLVENFMNVTMSDGTVFKFKECGLAL